eukprot:gene4417-14547_t
MIHSANAVAARHNVIPFCALCHVTRSVVFCRNDDAYLCASCDKEAHQSVLASRHERVPAAAASATPKVEKSSPEEVFCESSAANSEVLGDAPLAQTDTTTELTCPSSMGDFCVVPDLSNSPADEGAPSNPQEGDMKAKDMENLDMDTAWLDRLDMGFDFSDLLDAPDFLHDAGLVPTMSDSNVKEEQQWEVPVPQAVGDTLQQQKSDDGMNMWANLPCFLDNSESGFQTGGDCDTEDRGLKRARLEHGAKEPTSAVLPVTIVTPEQATVNRAERLAKCREKRKNRTFEKTIRYATRKAYAEIRPRIKGRFVKKEELDAYKALHGIDMMTAMAQAAASSDDCVVPDMAC